MIELYKFSEYVYIYYCVILIYGYYSLTIYYEIYTFPLFYFFSVYCLVCLICDFHLTQLEYLLINPEFNQARWQRQVYASEQNAHQRVACKWSLLRFDDRAQAFALSFQICSW